MTIPVRAPNPSLAIIMSVYCGDEPEQLCASLESILSQSVSRTHQVRLYLAIDGPVSSLIDNVIYKYQAEIYQIFRLDKNRGLAVALNHLIGSLEEEEYIFRMDADDISLPDRLEKQLAFMECNPCVDILGGAILEFSNTSPRVRLVQYPETDSEARRQIAYRSPVAHPSVCIRRTVFSKVGRYPEIGGNEDIALWFDCIKAGMVFANIPDPVLRFRISSDFWARRGVHKAKAELICYLKGLNSIEGLSFRMTFPVLRFLFRLSPRLIRKLGYHLRSRRYQD